MTAQPSDSQELANDDVYDLDEGELDDLAADDQVSDQPGSTAGASSAEVIVAEVMDVAPSLEPDSSSTPAAQDAGLPEATTAAAPAGQQWHAIQAMFVDDPDGAVRLAAETAQNSVRAIVSTLERQQAWMAKPDDAHDSAMDTEQLRTTLREFRAFCQRMDRLADQLPDSGFER